MKIDMTEASHKKNYVYNSIFEEIIRNNIDGYSLITEKALVEKYKVSKSPVREALLQLCSEDMLISIPRLGYRVKPVNMQDLLDATDFRILVEQAALEKTITHITDDQIKKLEDLYNDAIAHKDTKDAFMHWQVNSTFHMTLCSFSGNRFFNETLKTLLKTCYRGANEYFSHAWEFKNGKEDSATHKLIIEALKTRDLPLCKKLLKEDILDFSTQIGG